MQLERLDVCTNCSRKYHSICALQLHVSDEPRVCRTCQKYSAKSSSSIPRTEIGNHIERNVNRFLHSSEANASEREIRELGEIIVRVTSSPPQDLIIPPTIHNVYKELPVTLRYTTKTIFVFQKTENSEILFFAMCTDHFDSACCEPNKSKAYISYLDSVHHFSPRTLRTKAYQQILLAYLEFMKKDNYISVHLWACEPKKDQEYIFVGHPLEQQVPTESILTTWYERIFQIGKTKNIIMMWEKASVAWREHYDIMKMPLFNGDWWLDLFSRRAQTMKENLASFNKSVDSYNGFVLYLNELPSNKQMQVNIILKSTMMMSQNQNDNILFHIFFVSLLQPPTKCDEDSMIWNVISSRRRFINFQYKNRLSFRTVRLARFATMSLVNEMLQSDAPFQCDKCNRSTLYPFRCVSLKCKVGEFCTSSQFHDKLSIYHLFFFLYYFSDRTQRIVFVVLSRMRPPSHHAMG